MGLYPVEKRDGGGDGGASKRVTIVTRRLVDETLLPNEVYCERFGELIKAFSRRAAERCKSHFFLLFSSLFFTFPPRETQPHLPLFPKNPPPKKTFNLKRPPPPFFGPSRQLLPRNNLPQLPPSAPHALSASHRHRLRPLPARDLGHDQHHSRNPRPPDASSRGVLRRESAKDYRSVGHRGGVCGV